MIPRKVHFVLRGGFFQVLNRLLAGLQFYHLWFLRQFGVI